MHPFIRINILSQIKVFLSCVCVCVYVTNSKLQVRRLKTCHTVEELTSQRLVQAILFKYTTARFMFIIL